MMMMMMLMLMLVPAEFVVVGRLSTELRPDGRLDTACCTGCVRPGGGGAVILQLLCSLLLRLRFGRWMIGMADGGTIGFRQQPVAVARCSEAISR
ncbi:hypothetical protein BZA05DRAFT_387860 [Tricharina praecox]|uniref:uncharacterized protein n=1 Tax=Tricharina praecox TaxID=43433 RepID=UPI002220CEA8|nr:uncharacterized protein BZA05DRAFT_387860 [Tricharina praecox]KAI5856243.1 hypothetical protein BZA05DRAFT_387860 [Tricharina praecox]